MLNWLPRWLKPRRAPKVDRAHKSPTTKPRKIRVELLEDRAVPATLAINDVSMTEGNSGEKNFNFTVTLSQPSAQTVTVRYSTAEGTASDNIDFKKTPPGNSPTLTFAPGETTKTFAIRVN